MLKGSRVRPFAGPIALALAFAIGGVASGADPNVRVIVHPAVKGTQVQRATLGSIFLKQVPRWGDGTPVRPVDQSMRSPVRMAFATDVMRRPLDEVQAYWTRKMSEGVPPPPVKPSDQEVVKYVAATPGAIGYVSGTLALPAGVRALEVVD
jgi:ABC-type phosphate transport system substrate-binding protein